MLHEHQADFRALVLSTVRGKVLMRRFCAIAIGILLASHTASAEMQARSLDHGGAARAYLVFLPDGPRPAAGGMPLVVMLHGGGAPAELMALYSRFNEIAARENFAIIYPRGIGRWWNDGRLINGRGETDADDVSFIRAVVADFGAKVTPIDRSRIYASGISNGGFMSLRLACEAADLFTAVAPVAASMPEELGARCRPAKPVSVLVINGTADHLVPYVGGHARTGNTLRGAIWSTERTVGFWARHNRCADTPNMRVLPDVDPDDGSRVIESEYRGCADAPVKLLRIEGGGHTWPGGAEGLPASMVGFTNQDIDASEAIWEFFKSSPPRGGAASGKQVTLR
jgi:polyhydroxybutyrate depolymerase